MYTALLHARIPLTLVYHKLQNDSGETETMIKATDYCLTHKPGRYSEVYTPHLPPWYFFHDALSSLPFLLYNIKHQRTWQIVPVTPQKLQQF